MQPIRLARIFFVLIMTWCGYWLGRQNKQILEFTAVAFTASLFIVVFEHSSRVLSAKKVSLGFLGAFFGLAFGRLFAPTIPHSSSLDPSAQEFAVTLLFMYFGIVMALRQADRISLSRLRVFIGAAGDKSLLVDTSAIIDGRIIRLYEIGFLSRSTIVPTFVLEELQKLADSRDPEKRGYGRRGLENLEELRRVDASMQIFDKDYPEMRGGVDMKLIALAKEIGASIVSNDYNLCKIAALHQVKTMNINELAAATRLNLSIGDQVALMVQREGKEAGQGVGHLDDGTMVVVERGRQLIGQQVHVAINSIVQTSAGRLAFGRIIERITDQEDSTPAEVSPQSGIKVHASE